MAYDYQIRPGLYQAGYKDEDIGFDPNRQMVTLQGKDFLGGKQLTNVSGSTFTDRQSFDNALKKYQQAQQAEQNQQMINDLTSQVTNVQPQTNPYTKQLDDQIQYLMALAHSQNNVDPYSTPQYAAYKGQADRRADEGIRAAQEALGSAGFGRSTTLGQTAQREQNAANEYLETQVIPSILAAEEAKKQQQFANLASLLNPIQSQQGYFDTRAQTERGNALDALDLLLGQEQTDYDRRIAEQTAAQQALIDEETRARDAEQAQLDNLWTVAEQTGRIPDALADYYGLPRGIGTLEAERVGIIRMNAQTSARNAGTSAGNLELSRSNAEVKNFLDVWKANGSAPYDFNLNGTIIKAGTPYHDPVEARQDNELPKVDVKTSLETYNALYDDFLDDEAVNLKAEELGITPKEVARRLLEQNRNDLTDSDYKSLNSYINENF